MLEIKYLRKNLDKVKECLVKRGGDPSILDRFARLDAMRRDMLARVEALRHERNSASDRIAELKRNGADASGHIEKMRSVAAEIKQLETELADCENALLDLMLLIPNICHPKVPEGKDENDNELVREVGRPRDFGFEPLAHWTIGSRLGILDLERAARISGARFPLYMGDGALLERALINFMLDLHVQKHGYTEVLPPFIVNRQSMTNTGQLPKFEEDLFKLSERDFFLIPTAEVPVTNIHQDEILQEDVLPVKYVAYTPCFRAEAGSHGRDTRGLIRQHQFNKVELVKLAAPEHSYQELETLLSDAEDVLKALGLPYRVVLLCTGDLGFSAAMTYDIEVWMPAQGKYREISSCSNFEDFQARRAQIRFRRKGKKKTELVHTLNGSGLAVGRTVAAILENFQDAHGNVTIPEVLRPYMRGKEQIAR